MAEGSDDTLPGEVQGLNARPPRRRGPGRPFPKGVSGNPGGMSKEAGEQVAEAKRLGASLAPSSMRRLKLLAKSKDERVALAACVAILDRVGLRPFSTEPERLEVAHTVDVEALRRLLVSRAEALAGAHRQELALNAPVVEALPAGPMSVAGEPSALASDCDGLHRKEP